jgi:hypothetical protein
LLLVACHPYSSRGCIKRAVPGPSLGNHTLLLATHLNLYILSHPPSSISTQQDSSSLNKWCLWRCCGIYQHLRIKHKITTVSKITPSNRISKFRAKRK